MLEDGQTQGAGNTEERPLNWALEAREAFPEKLVFKLARTGEQGKVRTGGGGRKHPEERKVSAEVQVQSHQGTWGTEICQVTERRPRGEVRWGLRVSSSEPPIFPRQHRHRKPLAGNMPGLWASPPPSGLNTPFPGRPLPLLTLEEDGSWLECA